MPWMRKFCSHRGSQLASASPVTVSPILITARRAGTLAGIALLLLQFPVRAQQPSATARTHALEVLQEGLADRDPDTIKRDIDRARDQLASTVDTLAERANPRRIADDVKSGVLRFVKKPPVAISLAGVGAVLVVLFVRKRRR